MACSDSNAVLAAVPLPDIPLRTREGEADAWKECVAGSLWASQPAVILITRRPGCILCRAQATELWEGMHAELEAQGVSLVSVVHEWAQREIDAFHPKFWPGTVYHDVDKNFFKYLGKGKLLYANLWGMLNPFSAVWRRIMGANKKVKDHNMVGVGNILGGLLVVGKDGTVVYTHVERDLGLPAAHDEIRAAVKKVVAA
ncbi:hypothetical protein FOA52_016028 [Chlamydomonas sp. UWO 241]|nr:hypothetical protein FOA52_016028 [Chlamydomonas sp. UWO 241]